tara:strand:- start:16397 stop:16852 length:456 start_codon:yes stop_codon:yes gene_type:complete
LKLLDRDLLRASAVALAKRELAHREDVERARSQLVELRADVFECFDVFHQTLDTKGLDVLHLEVGEVRQDRKDFRSWECVLRRGRWKAILVAKSSGKLRCVGPFREGEEEGPCAHARFEEKERMKEVVEGFLLRFVNAAFDPERLYRKKKR